MNPEGEPQRRRRGAALEAAILEAVWLELVDKGYGALTFESVARRAGTSRPVLYRRWPTKADLVRAAMLTRFNRDLIDPPDTGNLRDDMVALLHLANEHRVASSALLIYYLGAFFQETGTSPQDFRADLLGDRVSALDVVIDRAVARGEIDPTRLSPRRRTVAIDLLRHDALMTIAPLSDAAVEEIVDDIFLPLVAADRSG